MTCVNAAIGLIGIVAMYRHLLEGRTLVRAPRHIAPNPDGARLSIPIVPCCKPVIGKAEDSRLRLLSENLLRDEPGLLSSREFDPRILQGLNDSPALVIGDQRGLNLYSSNPASPLEYRIALLAQHGDTVLVHRRCREFETYIERYLKIDGIQFVEVRDKGKPPFPPMSVRCRTDDGLRKMVRNLASGTDGMVVLPYLCTGAMWRLAHQIAIDTGVQVSVCGPSPRTSKRINDKIWFANRVRKIIGEHALPPTYSAYGPAASAAHVARLSRKSPRVIVKVPDSAGATGNITFESDEIRRLSLAQIRQRLLSVLHDRGWRDNYPILIGIWECDVISSPSVQMWIPGQELGPPVIEGIFEQRVQGSEGEFVGAVPAQMPETLHAQIADEAARLASVFQRVGYYGRCSLDLIVTRRMDKGTRIHWIECNGRWGGVSIPMTLANRLTRNQHGRGIAIIQQSDPALPNYSTGDVIERLKDLLYVSGSSSGGVVLLAPSESELGGGRYFMAIAPTQVDAESMAADAFSRLRS